MSRLEEICFRAHRMDLEEDFYPYGDGGEVRVRAALRRKEEELVLAAQLGNALLTENRQLKEDKNKLQEEYTEKIEVRSARMAPVVLVRSYGTCQIFHLAHIKGEVQNFQGGNE